MSTKAPARTLPSPWTIPETGRGEFGLTRLPTDPSRPRMCERIRKWRTGRTANPGGAGRERLLGIRVTARAGNISFPGRMNRNGQKRLILAPFGYFTHFRGKGANARLAARVVCGLVTATYVGTDCRKFINWSSVWFVCACSPVRRANRGGLAESILPARAPGKWLCAGCTPPGRGHTARQRNPFWPLVSHLVARSFKGVLEFWKAWPEGLDH